MYPPIRVTLMPIFDTVFDEVFPHIPLELQSVKYGVSFTPEGICLGQIELIIIVGPVAPIAFAIVVHLCNLFLDLYLIPIIKCILNLDPTSYCCLQCLEAWAILICSGHGSFLSFSLQP